MTPLRKAELVSIFKKLYPSPASELNFKNSYQLIVCVVLSAQCTDKKVNEVVPSLFKKFPDFAHLGQAKFSEVARIIRPINYYRTKSKNLIAMAKLVCVQHQGKVPQLHKELTALPGVGNKTANVVLSELGTANTFPVDTHVFRVSKRLGLAQGKTVELVEKELKQEFASDLWRPLHHWLIFHGRRVCKASRPRCEECQLSKLCPSSSFSSKGKPTKTFSTARSIA
jgi:endonuclease-3